MSTSDGRKIRRLTESAGFDGQISPRPRSSEIAILSLRGQKKLLYLLNTTSRKLSIINTRGLNDEFPAFSADGKELLWSRGIDDLTKSEIWLSDPHGGKAKAIISGSGHHLDPAWHPNGEEVLFASNRDDASNFEVYAAKKDGSCIRRLTYQSGLDRSPQVSPDGKNLLFTSDRSGQLQLYLAEYNTQPCPTIIESVQSK